MRSLQVLAACVLAALLVGCVSVGHEFPVTAVPEIAIGTTTQDDVQRLFGDPWRTGIEDGLPTWTYGHFRYSAFGPEQTRDLVIRFDAGGIVRSYAFNSTYPEDQTLGR